MIKEYDNSYYKNYFLKNARILSPKRIVLRNKKILAARDNKFKKK